MIPARHTNPFGDAEYGNKNHRHLDSRAVWLGENVVESDWAVFRAPVAEPGYCRPLTSVFPTFASGPFLTAV